MSKSVAENVIFSPWRKLNFTVTFNPYKFTDSDTILVGPELFEEVVRLCLGKSKWKGMTQKFFYVKEKHKNQRYHLHGQIFFEPEVFSKFRFDIFDMLNGLIKKKLGICVLKWDDMKIDDSKEYSSYLSYCWKDAEHATAILDGEKYYLSRQNFFNFSRKQNKNCVSGANAPLTE